MFISPTATSACAASVFAEASWTPLSQEPAAPVYVNAPMFQYGFETLETSFIPVEPPVS